MALEVLAGPYPITVDGVAIDYFFNTGGEAVTWLQGVGLYCGTLWPHGELPKVCVVQMDGVAHRRTPGNLSYIVLDLRAGTFGLAVRDNYSLYALNYLVSRNDPAPFYTVPSGFIADIRVICEDRFLRLTGLTVSSSPLYDGVNWTTEYTFPGSGGVEGGTISRGRGPYEICLATGAQIRFYDTRGKTQTGAIRYIGETPDACVCVPKWGVFVTVKSLQIKVLADAPRPYSISAPTLAPAATAGKVSVATVQVLGAQGEPCVGELIDWSITSGGGSLEAQSLTDGSGYATSNYIAPVGLTGSATLGAVINF
jgi:hypothetical protein